MSKLNIVIPTIHVLTTIEGIRQNLLPRLCAHFGKSLNVRFHDDLARNDIAPSMIAEKLQDAKILLGSTDFIQGRTLQLLPNLHWLQSTWAGVDLTTNSIDGSTDPPKCVLTRYVGNMGSLMAEFTIAHILSRENFIIPLHESQKQNLWKKPPRIPRLLKSLTIGVLGIGEIGMEIAKVCKLHGMTVFGLTRTKRLNGSEVVNKVFVFEEIQEMFQECDYICGVLPMTPQTIGFLDGDILSLCKKKPVLINVCRGDLISEDSIVKALDKGWISGAVLDVFSLEPLKTDSPLWNYEGVTITPHCAGMSNPDLIIDEFIANLDRYLNGDELKHIVDWQQGY